MVSCIRCRARFMANPEIEALWAEMHQRRFHTTTRATAARIPRPSFDAAKQRDRARRSARQTG